MNVTKIIWENVRLKSIIFKNEYIVIRLKEQAKRVLCKEIQIESENMLPSFSGINNNR